MMKLSALALCGLLACVQPAEAWSHQGHMLMTRLAALRIMDDPSAPQRLREFLAANENIDIDDCRRLATQETIGRNPNQFQTQLDQWVTLPDRIQFMPIGAETVQPYGVPEARLHFLDVEYFGPHAWYAGDLSNKPSLDDFPDDVKDARYRQAGFVPFRVRECCRQLAIAAGSGAQVADGPAALRWAGYLAHYVQDSHQPHHATADYKSLSYLAGRVPGIPAMAAQPTPEGRLALLHAPADVNPHGELEFGLFADDQPPLDGLREEFWRDLSADIDALAADQANSTATGPFDPFHWDLRILLDSYDYLPLIGRAAQAGYATGKFDPTAFFEFSGQVHGRSMTIVQLIALQNAKAVLATERAWREAFSPH